MVVLLHYGHYLAKTRQCPRCRVKWETFEEKMTDVNIAVELLVTLKTTHSTPPSSCRETVI